MFGETADSMKATLRANNFGKPLKMLHNITHWIPEPYVKDGQEFWMHHNPTLVRIAELCIDHPYRHHSRDPSYLPGVHDPRRRPRERSRTGNKIVPKTPGMDVKGVLVNS